jgi:hypothetical protein
MTGLARYITNLISFWKILDTVYPTFPTRLSFMVGDIPMLLWWIFRKNSPIQTGQISRPLAIE